MLKTSSEQLFYNHPISFTEQSLESCNKAFKSGRLHHSRRDSRLNTMTDQFNRQTNRSDLVIAMALQKSRKAPKSQELPQDVLSLISKSTVLEANGDESTDS